MPIKKEHDNGKTTTYKIKFIDSCRFMPSNLSDLGDNLSEINSKDCKTCMERKNIRSECKFIGFRNNRLNYRCKECKGTSTQPINELIKNFPSVYQFCDGDFNKFVLLWRKGVYPYEYMDSWEKFDENTLPPKEDFYSELNLEGISDENYAHAQKVWEVFEIRNRGEYHDLYVQSDTLLLADAFENFRDTCIEIYRLDPLHFLSAPGLAWQVCLQKTNMNLELLTDIDMLLMIEAGIRGGMWECVNQYTGMLKQIINTWKIMIKALSHHI